MKPIKKHSLSPRKDRVISLKRGIATFIHSDDLEYLSDLGELKIDRLSNVLYNNASGYWEVVYQGEVLCKKRTRSEAVDWEIKHFNKMLLIGKFNG